MKTNNEKTWTVTFTAGAIRLVSTMTGTRKQVKAWAVRELPYFAVPSYLQYSKRYTITKVK